MVRTYIVLSASALALAGIGANAQQGQGGSQRNYPVGQFDSVSSAGPHKVIVTAGSGASVRAEGPAHVLDRMEVVVEQGDLEIRPRREFRNNYRWDDGDRATFYVSAPRLKAAAVAGSGDMQIDQVEGDSFAGSIAGSGNMDVGSLRVSSAKLSIAGSGDFSARGSAGRSDISVAGSGNVKLGQLPLRIASVSIAGSGDVDLAASEQVDVSLIGSGNVAVSGTARCSVSRIGGGSVRCGR